MMRGLLERTASDRAETAMALSFSPTGDRVAAAVDCIHFVHRGSETVRRVPGRVEVAELAPGGGSRRILRDGCAARCLAFSPEGRSLAVGVADRTVLVWDLAALDEPQKLEQPYPFINDLAFSADGSLLAIVSSEHDRDRRSTPSEASIRVWDLRNGVERLRQDERLGIYSMAFAPIGGTLAVGTGWSVLLIDVPASGPSRRIDEVSAHKTHPASQDLTAIPARHLTFLAGGRRLAWICWTDLVAWDLDAKTKVAAALSDGWPIETLAASPDGRTLASGSGGGEVRIWGFDPNPTGELGGPEGVRLSERSRFDSGLYAVFSLAFSPDGSTLAVGGYGNPYLLLWDLEV